MIIRPNLFPEGRKKAITMSYDDAPKYDRELISISMSTASREPSMQTPTESEKARISQMPKQKSFTRDMSFQYIHSPIPAFTVFSTRSFTMR